MFQICAKVSRKEKTPVNRCNGPNHHASSISSSPILQNPELLFPCKGVNSRFTGMITNSYHSRLFVEGIVPCHYRQNLNTFGVNLREGFLHQELGQPYPSRLRVDDHAAYSRYLLIINRTLLASQVVVGLCKSSCPATSKNQGTWMITVPYNRMNRKAICQLSL
jgi:hypothetical protein